MGEAILAVLEHGQFAGELRLFFREVHGAERSGIQAP
jgi:hypothetical protein